MKRTLFLHINAPVFSWKVQNNHPYINKKFKESIFKKKIGVTDSLSLYTVGKKNPVHAKNWGSDIKIKKCPSPNVFE